MRRSMLCPHSSPIVSLLVLRRIIDEADGDTSRPVRIIIVTLNRFCTLHFRAFFFNAFASECRPVPVPLSNRASSSPATRLVASPCGESLPMTTPCPCVYHPSHTEARVETLPSSPSFAQTSPSCRGQVCMLAAFACTCLRVCVCVHVWCMHVLRQRSSCSICLCMPSSPLCPSL